MLPCQDTPPHGTDGPPGHSPPRLPRSGQSPHTCAGISANSARLLDQAVQRLRRQRRRHHWRQAKRLSPTITPQMICNWAAPGDACMRTAYGAALRARDLHFIRTLMIKLVRVRAHFTNEHNTHAAFMVDAALLHLAHTLKKTPTNNSLN